MDRSRDQLESRDCRLAECPEAIDLPTLHGELTAALKNLLPQGASILEAGCSEGLHSLDLARTGCFPSTLMDSSEQALASARPTFRREGLRHELFRGDVFSCGKPHYDVVFNIGALDKYSFQQQVDFLRGMASRSRRYVLVLLPNRLCYWYWMWRVRVAKEGNWLSGKQCPMSDVSSAFEAAGLRFLGHSYFGSGLTEDMIQSLAGLSEDFREDLLAVHRTALLDPEQKSYLIAALGCIGETPENVPAPWSKKGGEEFRTSQLGAALADALALRLGAEAQLHEVQSSVRSLTEELAKTRAENVAYRDFTTSTVFAMARLLQRVRTLAVPTGSLRARIGSSFLNITRSTIKSLGQVRIALAAARRPPRRDSPRSSWPATGHLPAVIALEHHPLPEAAPSSPSTRPSRPSGHL